MDPTLALAMSCIFFCSVSGGKQATVEHAQSTSLSMGPIELHAVLIHLPTALTGCVLVRL